MKRHTLYKRGFSLIEIIIAVGILGILMAASASMFSHQFRMMRGLYQQSELLDLKNLLSQRFSNYEVCSWQLKDKIINITNLASHSINLPKIHLGKDSSSPTLVTANKRLPGTTTNLKVEDIFLGKIASTGIGDEYKGTLTVIFDPNTAVRRNHVEIPLIFRVNGSDPPGARRIQDCFLEGYNGCYSIARTSLSQRPSTIHSIAYVCDGPGGNGTGPAHPNHYLASGSCTSTQGLNENRSGIASIDCFSTIVRKINRHTNIKLSMVCCPL